MRSCWEWATEDAVRTMSNAQSKAESAVEEDIVESGECGRNACAVAAAQSIRRMALVSPVAVAPRIWC